VTFIQHALFVKEFFDKTDRGSLMNPALVFLSVDSKRFIG